ncbi:MAG: 4Fe-4S double cluster binding domain-containing protein [Candidatus Thorarchaeota archaeon]
MPMNKDYTNELLEYSLTLGATLAGVADLESLQSLETNPPNLLKNFHYAISLAVVIPGSVFDLITNKNPGELYAHYYRTVNTLIDHITLRLSERIVKNRYFALAIPASLSIGPDKLFSNASHKAFARRAGLGWIGKNLLLITPEFGPRVRLGTVLTNIPLKSNKSAIELNCGNCTKCIDACPIQALKPSNFEVYPAKRENVFDAMKCHTRLEKLGKKEHIGVSICGVCIKVCPIGR